MKIRKAIKKARKSKGKISSIKCNMYHQTPGSLIFWLLENKDSDDEGKLRQLSEILNGDDWEVDCDQM